jgi:hypothetical protein
MRERYIRADYSPGKSQNRKASQLEQVYAGTLPVNPYLQIVIVSPI